MIMSLFKIKTSNMAHSCLVAAVAALVLTSSVFKAKAQITTACSSSMISSFTPCLNYVTGSSGSGSSPTQDCCNSLKSLMTDNMDCVCLIVTGNVPVSIPFINANLGISLPRVCKSSVPLQCKATGVPLPPPGSVPVLLGPSPAPVPVPVLLGPTLAPAPHNQSHSPKVSKAETEAAPPPAGSLDIAPVAPPPKVAFGPNANPGIRPVINPKSASTQSYVAMPSLVLMFAGIIPFIYF